MSKELNIPNHVGIILDGNGRWAEGRGLPRSAGHSEGMKTLKRVAKHALEKGVKTLSVFAFSSENFERDEIEVKFLMDLFVKAFDAEKNFFLKNNIKVVFSGRREPLSDKVYEKMLELSLITKEKIGGVLNICLNYGGQNELVDASIKIAEEYKKGLLELKDLNQDTYKNYLYNNLDDIDFLIRTSGEMRISNFMLYQVSYAELYFPKVMFPDFLEQEFDKAIIEYNKRVRKFGKNIK